jgi:glutathione-regulated potassium-efflux system protein KefB
MDNHQFLQSAVIFLLATVIAVPLSKRFRLGAVLGYLLAGLAIGPSGFGLIRDTAGVSAISEFGVVLMLFVIGLELSPQRLWVMRRAVFGSGVAQVVLCLLVLGVMAYGVAGMSIKASVIVGGALALSSTAFGLQILAERKEANSGYGRQGFAILLFQDLAAIPLIAAVPILGGTMGHSPHGVEFSSVFRVVGSIVAVIVVGRLVLRPVFRFVAKAGSVEVSTATALLVVMGTAWLMEVAGVSTTLGAFLAGVLLADSEYRHELESNIEPFKGLLLGLFFISVGMSVDLSLLINQPMLILGLVLGLMAIKGVLLWPLGRVVGRLDAADALRLSALLACGGEFAFVVLNLARQNSLIDTDERGVLVLVITLSMALTPLLVIGVAALLNVKARKPDREFDTIDVQDPKVIIAGFGRMGQIVSRVLRAHGIPFVALENSVEQVEFSRSFGGTSLFFGDPARPELLRAAQAHKAEVFVLTTDDPDVNLRVARIVRRQFPHLKIVARARNRQHVFRLMDLGIDEPVRETFHSSLKMTQQVLEALGMAADVASERVDQFRKHDETLLAKQYLIYDDDAALRQSSKDALGDLQKLFEADTEDSSIRP